MTAKRSQQKADWASVKKYVTAQMRDQRAWTERKLAVERKVRTQQFVMIDEQCEIVAREVARHRDELASLGQ